MSPQTSTTQNPAPDALVERLRRAGCVFAEEEARILRHAATGAELESLCSRRERGEVLEHLVGEVEIYGEILAVGPGAFVPRQRTSLLIDESLAEARSRDRPVVLEAYCGVAPVAALIARRVPGVRLHATDRDERALVHARRNLPASAAVHHGSGLSALPQELAGRVDLITAVPPYVPAPELELMPREARDHEAAYALVAGQDGLDEVRRLLREAPQWLAPGGILLMEMHREQGPLALMAAQEGRALGAGRIVPGADGETVIVRLPARPATVPGESGESGVSSLPSS